MFRDSFIPEEQQLIDLKKKYRGCARCHKQDASFVACHYEGSRGDFDGLILFCKSCLDKSMPVRSYRDQFDFNMISGGMNKVLRGLGVDNDDKHTKETAFRAAKAFVEILSGMIEPEPNISVFESDFDEMVLVKNIEFVSMCAHHMLPFVGIAHVGYLPDKKIIGLSKIPRIVEFFAKRLQVQEELTKMVADYLSLKLNPRGVGVIVIAKHDCVACRGVKSKNAEMVTSMMLGEFRESPSLKAEFMRLLAGTERG